MCEWQLQTVPKRAADSLGGEQVFRLDHAAQDVERLYATGLFEYVDVLPRASALEGTQVRRCLMWACSCDAFRLTPDVATVCL